VQELVMARYEYRIVPAPLQGKKGKGRRTAAERFAYALETLMNELGQDGWDYVRADTLPCEERTGLTGRTTTYQNMLVFRRTLPAETRLAEDVPGPAVAGLLAGPLPEEQVAPGEVAGPGEGAEGDVERGPAGGQAASGAALVEALSRHGPHGAAGSVHAEPPLTRQPHGPAPRGDMSAAARAAAAALRTYRAGAAADGDATDGSAREGRAQDGDDGSSGRSRRGGGFAAE
jgi:hypothetical protein